MIKPLMKNILVKQEPIKNKTDKGLILTTTTVERPAEGVIVAMASDCTVAAYLGNTVLFNKFAGSQVKDIDDQEYLVLHEEDLLGVRI
jgi:chaperonin GroES